MKNKKEIKKSLDNALDDAKWVYGYAKKHIIFIIIYTLLGMSSTVANLFNGLVSKDLVDIITGHQTGALIVAFLSMIGIQLISIAINNITNYVSTYITTKVDQSIKADTYDKIMNSEWESLTQYHSGKILMRWQGDSSQISSGVLSIVPSIVNGLFRFISSLILICRYDPSFALFSLLSVPISFSVSRLSMKKMRKAGMASAETSAKMSSFSQDSFSDIQNVKALDLLKLYRKRLREIQKQALDDRMKYQRITAINSIILVLVSQGITYATYGWGVYRVWSGVISYGTMTMFLSLSSSLSGTAQSLLGVVPNAIRVLDATKRLREITDLPKEDYSLSEDVLELKEKSKDKGIGISLEDVSFNYMGKDNVFEHSALLARPHEVVGLVGPSGGGKTTTLRLLLAIINSKSGESFIFEEGNEENRLPLTAASRQLMAYVPQGNSLFAGTIADNMRNVKEDASDEEIIEALKMAEAWSFIKDLPDGIYTELKERGAGFSEGQTQRLSIARALLRKSPILLLDEATSALDIKTADKVLNNIISDTYPRTCILTTHKPEVMKLCNKVYVIDEKEIRQGELL